MALSDLFLCPQAVKRNSFGPLGDFQDGFHEWLDDGSYSRSSLCHKVNVISKFSRFLDNQAIHSVKQITRKDLSFFLEGQRPEDKWSTHQFVRYLETLGLEMLSKPPDSSNSIISHYKQWLDEDQNLYPSSYELREGYLIRFLEERNISLTKSWIVRLTGHKVECLFLEYSEGKNQAARRSMQATLRSFLRFCYLAGLHKQDLSFRVPGIHVYRLSNLPKAISECDAVKLIKCIDPSTAIGVRDLAIINLLFYYGLRGGQVQHLAFEDIDWRNFRITIKPLKQGKLVVFPLLPEVGNALLKYVKEVRPTSGFSEIFLGTKAPYKPLSGARHIYQIISHWAKKADLSLPSMGCGIFRHGFATRMLELNYPLKHIADSLGHRCIETTSIYTKVDVNQLKDVAIELPQGGLNHE
ncbi:MAG: site-specific integrase [Pseudomonadales bacterium]